MKKVFLMFIVSLCFGLIAVLLWTGPAYAAKGGIAGCQAALNTCNADLSTCNTDLGSCTTDLDTCNSGFGTCQTNLTQAQGDLSMCSTDLDTCITDLGSCTSNLSYCQSQLSQVQGDLATCSADLSACQVATCGNGIAEFGEACDGENLQGDTCQTQGFLYGTLACNASCEFDTSGCTDDRFVDNGDGTVTDNQTGLMWEKKNAAGGGADLTNPHDVDNRYNWSATGTAPDGTAFTDFLRKLNNTCNGSGVTLCAADTDCSGGVCGFAGHRDWRLPQVGQDGGTAELETILVARYPNCPSSPCIDPIFSPAAIFLYWSAVTSAAFPGPDFAWVVVFSDGSDGAFTKVFVNHARAVRTGP